MENIPVIKVGSDGKTNQVGTFNQSSPAPVIDLDNVKPVESAGVDLKKHDKKETVIENAIVIQVPTTFNDLGKQWVLKVEGNVVETLDRTEGKIEFRASELFNLIQNDKGELVGFPTGEGSNLMKFLKDIGVEHAEKMAGLGEIVRAMKGHKSLIKAYSKKSTEGQERTFLRFRY